MANKEAAIYIVDLGSSMGDCHNGRIESDLDWSLRYVWDKITTTAQRALKGKCVGVLGLRTDETNNRYAAAADDDEENENKGYDNISELMELGPMSLPRVKALRAKLRPSETETGDAMSAIILAGEIINGFTLSKSGKPLQWKREIYLITGGTGAIDEDDVDAIAARLTDIGIKLTIMQVPLTVAERCYRADHLRAEA